MAKTSAPSRSRIEEEVASVVLDERGEAGARVAPSRGHLAWLDDGAREAYDQGGEVYVAPSDRPLDVHGYRQGGRWESSISHWRRYFEALFRPRVSGPPSPSRAREHRR